ncbi:TIGR04168 family protein [Chlorogloea sp. CCALA 695]|uniref:TIGR04168 family protein n=1 Tax=Chlorogloea sp. CCALA 695 TaxID=2107693 RepID=UPI000D068C2A|nr:TIGR04168 family protein [Chlorogloea sp. CCALA 695]PSB32089.1 TIGR04168 family protein [Chlorogloea sp. CCALA 695]
MTSQSVQEQEDNISSKLIKIAIVGDVHDRWEAADEIALQHLGVDLVLFVGDFGNESVQVVREIAVVKLPKAAVFGNHDAWYSASDWGKQKCPYDRQKEDWVQDQIDLLKETHVGYSKLDFPELQLTVVGSRPFSWGGDVWKNAEFYKERFGVTSFAESTAKIVAAAETSAYDTVIFLGHNGPVGLGSNADDPCGKDWQPLGGDYGDPDLTEAIALTRKLGKTIPLVTFGHMHHDLRYTKQHLRKTFVISSEGTMYLNAARVPRIVQTPQGDKLRNFSLVYLQGGVVTQASLVWMGKDFTVVSEEKQLVLNR